MTRWSGKVQPKKTAARRTAVVTRAESVTFDLWHSLTHQLDVAGAICPDKR